GGGGEHRTHQPPPRDEDDHAQQRHQPGDAAEPDGERMVGVVVDADRRGPGLGHHQADEVPAEHQQDADVEQRAAPAQDVALVQLRGAGGPAELVVPVAVDRAQYEHHQGHVRQDRPEQDVRGAHLRPPRGSGTGSGAPGQPTGPAAAVSGSGSPGRGIGPAAWSGRGVPGGRSGPAPWYGSSPTSSAGGPSAARRRTASASAARCGGSSRRTAATAWAYTDPSRSRAASSRSTPTRYACSTRHPGWPARAASSSTAGRKSGSSPSSAYPASR